MEEVLPDKSGSAPASNSLERSNLQVKMFNAEGRKKSPGYAGIE